MKLTKTVQPR